ncbi:SusC/RagA family TonB-linked outer membrane protein [Flavivirga spongiicola]|uniref:SusC/RagA family TonB-linked outer membrane protein n=1 Tax=Flavivirga spongiicola TaxID=421621 RepID=A0ABU7XRI9_9FLAO|nr:SusC/RagA family TonB-linked outer membrane protein [Flavivirga sp. MEBiC05379]MDO5977447.1 SusC/RagA family TonB-linked outer membrane protein [Flavivirga sp. MEBiC05379]
MEEVINAIETLTDYKFFVNTQEVDLKRLVSIQEADKFVPTILEKLFFDTPVSYEILGKQIVLKKTKAILYHEISGIVNDAHGDPLSGTNVIIENTYTGVVTDFDGKFTIRVPNGNVLVFSYIGMSTKKVKIEENQILNIKLIQIGTELEEVIIVGYGFKKKINLSGAVASVNEEVLENRGNYITGEALQGTIANLNIVSTGNPNTVPSFNIRGFTSISGGKPLVVIDGVAGTEKDLARMASNDIASISVLKDAASASIFGSRASFGVILIETKKGVSDKMQVNVNVNASVKTLGRTPEMELDPYKVASFKDLMAVPWYDFYSVEDLEYAKQVSLGNADPTRINPARLDRYQYFHSTNWKEIILKKISSTNTINMNISQKFEKGSYYFGVEGIKSAGVYAYNNDIHKRTNLRLKSSYELADWLNFSNNTWIYNNNYDESNAAGSEFFREIINRFTLDPLYNPDGSPTYSYARMIGRLEAGNYTTNEINYQSKFGLDMNFFDNRLKVVAVASYKRLLTSRDAFDNPVRYSEGPGHSALTGPSEPWAGFVNWKEEYNNYNIHATFTDVFNDKHKLTLLTGYNQEEFNYKRTSGERAGLISEGLPSVNLATGNQTVSENRESWALQGIFSRANYIFDDKYIFEINVRYDGSSRYFKNDRWVLNPSASVSWIASKEGFLEDSFVELLKFRASYGSLGNQNADPYASYSFLPTGNASALINGKNIVEASAPGLVAPSFTWETIQTRNIGIDLAFLNNRLTSNFDYYHRLTLNMFAPGKELPAVLGTAVPNENATDLITKGWEFNLVWRDKFDLWNKSFRYSIDFNLGDSQTWITKFPNSTGDLDQFYKGQKIGELWGFVTDGYYQTQEEIDFGPDNTDVASYPSTRPTLPGDVKFTDLNGDGKISYGNNTLTDPGDRRIIGNSSARYNFGLNLNVAWNGFDFRTFFQGVGKRDFYPGGNASRYYFWSAYAFPWASVTKENYNNHWTPNTRNAFYPRPKSYVAEGAGAPGGGPAEVSLAQTRWLQDASYVRLKNVTIGYSIPSDVCENIGVTKLRLYLSGENLYEITKLFKYLDPENLEGDGYPFRRTFSLGLSLAF